MVGGLIDLYVVARAMLPIVLPLAIVCSFVDPDVDAVAVFHVVLEFSFIGFAFDALLETAPVHPVIFPVT